MLITYEIYKHIAYSIGTQDNETEKSNDEITLFLHAASFVIARDLLFVYNASILSCFISIPVPANLPTNLSNVLAGLSCWT
jgi:hypothetical protein